MGKEVIGQTLLKMKSQSEDGKQTDSPQANDGLMALMGSFTLLRLLKLMGLAGSVRTKADLLDINKRLNRIKKPETLNKDYALRSARSREKRRQKIFKGKCYEQQNSD